MVDGGTRGMGDGTAVSLLDLAAHDVQATFCATLVDDWISSGVRHAVVAPGSRSTPMALALADRDELDVHVVHDERVAGFVALGLGLAPHRGTGRGGVPAILLCTSGTAAANFAPAVAEAGQSDVPMLVVTADRPEELRGVGAPQTIDQIELYGRHVRWFHDADVPIATAADGWRPLAQRAFDRARRGPVHMNLPFREPLIGTPGALPDVAGERAPSDRSDPSDSPDPSDLDPMIDPVPSDVDRQRGVIIVGGAHDVDPDRILDLASRAAWPVIADAQSALRHHERVVTTIDALLRHERFAADHAPEVVVRIGRPSASKLLAQWTARPDLMLIQVGGPGRIDPAHNVTARCSIDALLAAELHGSTGTTWLARWTHAEQRAAAALAAEIERADTLTEPAVARIVADHRPTGAQLTVSSSMPVRDLEWFGGSAAAAHANRGANGIDGVVSTALGRLLGARAREGREATGVVLVGDLAFVHDSNALVGLTDRDVDLRVVVVDNDGGGIFSFLPQATTLGRERFEQLFGTPLRTDVLGLAAAHGIPTAMVTTSSELIARLADPGPWVVRVPTDRAANVVEHERLNAVITAALD